MLVCLMPFDIKLAAASVTGAPRLLSVMQSWQDATTTPNNIYGFKSPIGKTAILTLVTETPISIVPRTLDRLVEFDEKEAETLAGKCKDTYSSPWDQIGCVSMGVHQYFSDKQFTGFNSFCRSHAYAFRVAFSKLEIPRSNATTMAIKSKQCIDGDCFNHAVNRIILVSERGQPFAYVVDSGWFPMSLFPLTPSTVKYHEAQNIRTLPTLNDRTEKETPCYNREDTSSIRSFLIDLLKVTFSAGK